MELLVLNTNYESIAVLDTYESLIWTDRYNSYGDFEMFFAMDESSLEYLKEDNYLWLKDSEHTMIIEDMLKSEAFEKYPGVYWNALDWTETWPGGESPEQFFHRIQSAWYEFKKQVGSNNVLLVSHGGVMNIIMCLENGIPYTNKETHFQIKDAEIVPINTWIRIYM